MKIYLDNNLGVTNVEQEELTQDTIGYNILKVYIPNAVLTPYDTFTCYYGAVLQNGRKVGWFAMEARTSSDADYEANYTLYKATLEQCVVSVEGKVYIGCQVLLGNSGNATLIKKNTAVVQFNVRKSVAINNDILVLDPDQTNTDVLESYKNLLENALLTYVTKASIADDLTTNDSSKVLSAKQGKVLKDTIDGKADKTTAVSHDGNQLKDNEGNVLYPNVDPSIYCNKNAVSVSNNLYNYKTDTLGYVISSAGDVTANSEYRTSDYIFIGLGETFSYKKLADGVGCVFFALYNNNKTFIRRVSANSYDEKYTMSDNEYYIRVCSYKFSTPYMINLGNTLLSYVDYGTELTKEINAASGELWDFYYDGRGKYLSASGVEKTSSNWCISDYIPINYDDNISYSGNTANASVYLAFYTSSKVFISSIATKANDKLAIPYTAKYLRVSVYIYNINDYKLIRAEKTQYERVEKTIKYLSGYMFDSAEYTTPNGSSICNDSMLYLPKGTIFTCDSSLLINITEYNLNGVKQSFRSASSSPYVIQTDCLCRFSVLYVSTQTNAINVNKIINNFSILKPITLDKVDYSIYNKNSIINYGNLPKGYYHNSITDYSLFEFEVYGSSSAVYSAYDDLVTAYPSYITKNDLGTTTNGTHIYEYVLKPIELNYFGKTKKNVKILLGSAIQGTEPGSVYGLYYFVKDILTTWNNDPIKDYFRNHCEFHIVPLQCPSAFDLHTYWNENEVSINRNFDTPAWTSTYESNYDNPGTSPASEPETIIIQNWMKLHNDAIIYIDFHTFGEDKLENYEYVSMNSYPTKMKNNPYVCRLLKVSDFMLSSISEHFKTDYGTTSNELYGHIQWNDKSLSAYYAYTAGIMGIVLEGNPGLPNFNTRLTGDCFKSNSEILGNYLIDLLNEFYLD